MKINWFHLVFCIFLWGAAGVIVHELMEMPKADTHGILLAAIFSAFGFYSFIMAFFEPAIMRLMYGEFSNRNPWGY